MTDFGLLLLRLAAGGTMLLAHGLPKLSNYSAVLERFPDPIGLGVSVSLTLVIVAEVLCAGLLVLGLFSRMALVPLITTMGVAFFVVHGADPFKDKELSLIYLAMYVTLFLTGPGRLSAQNIFQISAGRFSWLLK